MLNFINERSLNLGRQDTYLKVMQKCLPYIQYGLFFTITFISLGIVAWLMESSWYQLFGLIVAHALTVLLGAVATFFWARGKLHKLYNIEKPFDNP